MKPNKIHEQNAAFFQALSHRRRQMLFEILKQHGADGLPFHRLQNKSGLSSAILSHHLRFMTQGGILQRTQKGRETWISLDIAHLGDTAAWLGKHMTIAA